jgi:hypothetical protein
MPAGSLPLFNMASLVQCMIDAMAVDDDEVTYSAVLAMKQLVGKHTSFVFFPSRFLVILFANLTFWFSMYCQQYYFLPILPTGRPLQLHPSPGLCCGRLYPPCPARAPPFQSKASMLCWPTSRLKSTQWALSAASPRQVLAAVPTTDGSSVKVPGLIQGGAPQGGVRLPDGGNRGELDTLGDSMGLKNACSLF